MHTADGASPREGRSHAPGSQPGRNASRGRSRGRTVPGSVASLALLGLLGGTVGVIAPAAASPAQAPAAVASATARTGTSFASAFAEPPNDVLPAARYWVSSGTGDPQDVAADIHAMAANDIGSATFNDLVLAQVYDPTKSFTSPAWSNKLRTALTAANEEDMKLDVLISPGWSAGSALVGPDSPGASKVLGNGRSNLLAAGQTFNGQVPLSALAGGVTKRVLQGVIAVRCTTDCTSAAGQPVSLVRSSVVDLTSTVTGSDPSGDGVGRTVTWTAPGAPADGSWLVLAFWSQGSGLRPTAGIDAQLRNTYQVDHFSSAGTQALIDPWNTQVLDDDLRSRLRDNGGSMWLDSVELHDVNWTDGFLSAYRARTGRSYIAGLPTVATDGPGPFTYDDGSAVQYKSEWTRQMNNMFIRNHIDPLKDWAHSLGMTLRYQSYITIGPQAALIPDEAWAELDVLDAEAADARAVASIGAIEGDKVNATECCAFLDFQKDSWRQRWPDMLYRINQSFSTGTNKVEYHGFSQSHGGRDLTFVVPGQSNSWPGWNPFVPVTGIGDSWDARQPSWADSRDINRYIGRNQMVLRTGSLRSDFAVYTARSRGDDEPNGEIESGAVASSGYSWGYLSDKFVREAPVRNGVLYPAGPRYRALVLNQVKQMPVDVARRIVAMARQGLPVVVLGDTPTTAVEAVDQPQASTELVDQMRALLALPGVVQLPGSGINPEGRLPQALRGLGVGPAVNPAAPTTLQTITRTDGPTTFVYAFNTSKTDRVRTTLDVDAPGRPYALDTWNGTITAAPQFTSNGGRTSFPVDVAPGDTVVMAVTTNPSDIGAAEAALPATSSTGQLVAAGSRTLVRSASAGTIKTALADGRTVLTPIAAPPATVVPRSWDLSVQSWEKPTTGVDSAKRVLPTTTLAPGPDGRLPGWQDITAPVDLRGISGLGTYRTEFTLGPDWTTDTGAVLDLGSNFQTYQVAVNGTEIQGENQNDASRIDLGKLLHPGNNTLEVRVSTTLGNAILAQAPSNIGGPQSAPQQYGLTGPVALTPYREASLDLSTPAPATTLKVSVKPSRIVAGRTRAKVRVNALALDGSQVTGKVRIKVKGKTRVAVLDRGRAVVKLPVFARAGRKKITVILFGTSEHQATTAAVVIRVRHR